METIVPEQIRKQAEEADKLYSQLYGNQPAEEQADTVAESAPTQDESVAQSETVAEAAQPDVNAVEQEEPRKREPQDDFEHKYKTLKGKYDAEVPRLYQQLKERDAQLQQLLARLEALERKADTNEQPHEEPTKVDKPAFATAKDREEFGEDFVEMVERVATAAANHAVKIAIAESEKRVAAVLQQLGMVQQQVQMSEAEKFWSRVRALVPDWDTIDQDPEWIAFLDSTPEFTTETYRELAIKAIQAGQPEKIAKLVEIWRGPQKPVNQAPKQSPAELQRQVQPSTVKAAAPATPQGKIYTRAEYEALLDPRNIQRYGAKKAAEMAAEADRAVAEGRVMW